MNKTSIILIQSPSDYEQALVIRREVFVREQKVPESVEIDSFEKSAHHFLAKANGTPAGAGRLRLKGPLAKFERIATLSKYRGQGIGRDLVDFMERFSDERFPEHLRAMHAQQSAIGFYEKLGWVGMGEVFYEAGIPHQMLIKPPAEKAKMESLLIWCDPEYSEAIGVFLKSITASPEKPK